VSARFKARGDQIRVGRVLHEDDAFLTLEVAKDEHRPLSIESGDRFLTLVFVRSKPTHADPQRAEAWLPWEETDGAT
jgi:hypothetical protein